MALPSVTLGGGIMEFHMSQGQGAPQQAAATGALPSVTIGGNTQYMNPGIQAGSIMMPQQYAPQQYAQYAPQQYTTVQPEMMYAAPAQQYTTLQPEYATTAYAAPPSYQTTYAPPQTTYMAPQTTTALDVNRDGRADYYVTGADLNRDGIADQLAAQQAAPYYAQQQAMMMQMPQQYTTLPTSSSMVAYPAVQQFSFYPAGQLPAQVTSVAPTPTAAPTSQATRDAHVASKPDPKAAKKKKKSGSCGMCCGPKKATAKKK